MGRGVGVGSGGVGALMVGSWWGRGGVVYVWLDVCSDDPGG